MGNWNTFTNLIIPINLLPSLLSSFITHLMITLPLFTKSTSSTLPSSPGMRSKYVQLGPGFRFHSLILAPDSRLNAVQKISPEP